MVEIKGNDEWSQRDIAKAIQDYLICIEMFVAAIGFTFAFPVNEYAVLKSKNLHNNYSILARKSSDTDFRGNISSNGEGGIVDRSNLVGIDGADDNNDDGDGVGGEEDDALVESPDKIDNDISGGQPGDRKDGNSGGGGGVGGGRGERGGGRGGPDETGADGNSPDSKQRLKPKRPFLSAFLASASPDEFLEDMRRFLGGQELSSIFNTNSSNKTQLISLLELNNNKNSDGSNGNGNGNGEKGNDASGARVDSANNYDPC